MSEIFGECEKHPGWGIVPECYLCEQEKLYKQHHGIGTDHPSLFANYKQVDLLDQISRLNEKIEFNNNYWESVVDSKIKTHLAYVDTLEKKLLKERDDAEEFGRKAFYEGREVERYNHHGIAVFLRPTFNGYLRELDKAKNNEG